MSMKELKTLKVVQAAIELPCVLTKGTDFGTMAEGQIVKVESKLNNRPRKCLGCKTPLEVASVVIMAGTTGATAYLAQGVYAVNNGGCCASWLNVGVI